MQIFVWFQNYIPIFSGIENKSSFKLAWPHPSHKESKGNEVKFAVLQLVRALFQASFSYFGYSYVTYIMEDVENPLKSVKKIKLRKIIICKI